MIHISKDLRPESCTIEMNPRPYEYHVHPLVHRGFKDALCSRRDERERGGGHLGKNVRQSSFI